MNRKNDIGWREKILSLNKEIESLKKKAMSLVGTTDFELIKNNAREDLRSYLAYRVKMSREFSSNSRFEHFRVFPVSTNGVPCHILNSSLYPEFGFLIFDGYKLGSGGTISFGDFDLSIVCGCCHPHLEGLPGEKSPYFKIGGALEKKREELKKEFVLAIRQACETNGVSILFLACYEALFEQEETSIRFIGHQISTLKNNVDRWRFAAAFKELTLIGGYKFPFDEMFEN